MAEKERAKEECIEKKGVSRLNPVGVEACAKKLVRKCVSYSDYIAVP